MAILNDSTFMEDDLDELEFSDDQSHDSHGLTDFKCDDVASIASLQASQWFNEIMKTIDDSLQKHSTMEPESGIDLDDDNHPEYKLIAECNLLLAEIGNEIGVVHKFICDKYSAKFPELETLVQHPVDFARVVKVIGNEMDLTRVNLDGILPSAIIMVVSVTASTTTGKPLPEDSLRKTIDACDHVLSLDSSRSKILEFLQIRMPKVAPNLSAIVGPCVASELIGCAGGLSALARLPDCIIRCLGSKRKNLAGFSSATVQSYLEQTEIYQSTPPNLRKKACRFLSAKSCLAARVDSLRSDPTGAIGRAMREEICKKIKRLQQCPPATLPKPLPVRDCRRLRKMKEMYATNLVTAVAVLFAMVAFASIFTVMGGDGVAGTASFMASSYIIVGRKHEWVVLLVTLVGAAMMVSVLGTMTYYVVKSKRTCSLKKSARRSPSNSHCPLRV